MTSLLWRKLIKAIHKISSEKAPGSDSIPIEIYKYGGKNFIEKLHIILKRSWKSETVPQNFRDATIIHLYKRKGNRQSCNNHRGISLLSIAGKIFARILLNHLTSHLNEGLLPESQCGFRKEHGTTDMIFAERQLQEKCQEQHCDLYTAFIDLTKAFHTVSRVGLWKILAKYGCPQKFITIVKQLHDGMQARVQDDGELSEMFPVSNGVKQGCVLAPTLFSIMFSAMLDDAFRDLDLGVNIIYRIDGQLFNLRRLRAKTKVKSHTIRDLLFADDCALNANTEADLQSIIDRISKACTNFGLTINTEKTEVMLQPAPGKSYFEPCIKVNGVALKVVNRFTYLGSTLSQDANVDDEVYTRIAKASSTFGTLYANVWRRNGINLQTKLKVYRAVVFPVLLYASET